MQTIDTLDTKLRNYLSPEQSNLVRRAFYYAEQAHYGQYRRSGEPYVSHPLAVTNILAEMRMDHQSLIAAMLHDVIEDTRIDKKTIENQFGEIVAELVDGVSKLTQIEFSSFEEKQAENFRKMALAMARDIRVILVKLADRLHNMRTLSVLPLEKAKHIAKETLEIYAPIAMRLGMNSVRVEYEDLGFSALYPMRARRIEAALRTARGNRKALVEEVRDQLEKVLAQEGHEVEITGREKHLYSIYQKMRLKRKAFSEIMDIYAFRIVVDSVDTCYRVLGCVHGLYKPLPGSFKDYIAVPKINGYQSLHTVLNGVHGVPIEIQIRTREMESMANNGIAGHWLYKGNSSPPSNSEARAREWIQGLLDMQQRTGDSLEFIENVKIDLFPDEIYVFTPKGRILELPRNATAVDFAYAVHTDIGNKCVACRINRRLAPLSEPLESGETVEILLGSSAHPNPAWLNYVVTAKARTNIHHFLKNQTREDSIDLGKRLLEKSLLGVSNSLEKIKGDLLDAYLARHEYASLDDLLADIGRANRLPSLTSQQLTGKIADSPAAEEGPQAPPLAIRGTEGFVVNFAKCCYPIPGDPISGYLSAEKGVVVHRESCKNLMDLRNHMDRLVMLRWHEEVEGEYAIELRIELENKRGQIAVMATELNSIGINIEKISSSSKDYQFVHVDLELHVRNRIHLAQIMRRLRAVNSVRKVLRVNK